MFHVTLDRFEANLEATAIKMKRDLCEKMDQRVALIKQNINSVRSLGPGRRDPDFASMLASSDGPLVETVSVEQYVKHRREKQLDLQQADHFQNDLNSNQSAPSTSTGTKRKFSSTPDRAEKRPKTNSNAGAIKKYVCKFNGCGSSFSRIFGLIRHERIHLKIRPFTCAWPECINSYSSEDRQNVIRHIRVKHFKLPLTTKEQREKNIEDDRDPNDYVRVDQELLSRRLE